MRIGILGGSFDPVHLGHLNLAEGLRCASRLDRVIFMPTYDSYHKVGHSLSHHNVRLRLIEAAIASNPHFQLSTLEIERKKPSFTYETFDELKKLYPEHEIFFLGGSDLIFGFEKWHNSDYLLQHASFILALRAGDDELRVRQKLAYLRKSRAAEIELVRIPLLELSSSYIRKRLARAESIRYLVPEACEDIIYREGLYKDQAVRVEEPV